MKTTGKLVALAVLAVFCSAVGLAGCAAPAPQKVAELRDYPGQSFYCYLHKTDAGC